MNCESQSTSSIFNYYDNCALCARNCSVNRNLGRTGFCKSTSDLQIASAGLHFGEEPVITVFGGSGTIFVTGCNLHCAFCQNYQISQDGMGRTVKTDEFVKICLTLQQVGAENINIVTGSHVAPSLATGIAAAKKEGLTIPVCWNSSGYESVDVVKMLDGLVDIWLPDLKTLNPEISEAVFKTADYPSVAKKAIRQMIAQTPQKIVKVKDSKTSATAKKGSSKEKMLSGVVIRHLLLPGRMNDTVLTLDWLKKHADSVCISVMTQYTPIPFNDAEKQSRSGSLSAFQNRFVNENEYHELTSLLESYDFSYLFYQELNQDTEWLPDFRNAKPFPAAISKPIWHWRDGFLC